MSSTVDHDARPATERATVSVAMATWNGAAFVAEQLASILRQTRPPDEIVICDDASDDDTVDVCRRITAASPVRIRIVEASTNRGVDATFERAVRATRGDIVFLADQDDVWYDRKVATVLAEFERRPEAVVIIHDLDFCDEAMRPIGQTKLERFRALRRSDDAYVTGMATAIRRPVAELALPVPKLSITAYDNWFHFVGAALGGRVVLRETLAGYRRHASNATASGDLNVPSVVRRQPMDGATLRRRLRVHADRIEERLALCALERGWVERHATTAPAPWALSQGDADALLARLETTRAHAALRRDALARPRWARVPAVVRAVLDGAYRGTGGPRALLLDLAAPRRGARR